MLSEEGLGIFLIVAGMVVTHLILFSWNETTDNSVQRFSHRETASANQRLPAMTGMVAVLKDVNRQTACDNNILTANRI